MGDIRSYSETAAPGWMLRSSGRPEIVSALQGYLIKVRLHAGLVLDAPGKPITYLFFPKNCLVTLTAADCGHMPIGVGIVGWGGMTGLGLVLGSPVGTHAKSTVETSGVAWALAAEDFAYLSNAVPEIHQALLNLALAQFDDVSASAFALGRLSLPARLAWWLLRASAACRQDVLQLTHHRLAVLIGAQRPSITLMLAQFEKSGAVRTKRQQIEIVNRGVLARFVRPPNGNGAAV